MVSSLFYEIIRAGLVSGALYLLWRAYKELCARSPLDNIPGPGSTSFLKGNFVELMNAHNWEFLDNLGTQNNQVVRLHGPLGSRQLFVFDPVALTSVIVKDQYVYEERAEFLSIMHLMLGDGLLATLGDQHRKQRKMLNPVFSINHMRTMLPTFYKISHDLRDAIAAKLNTGAKEVDVLDWLGRVALELIGQAGLGYSFDPLIEDRPDDFGDAIKAIVPTLFSLRLLRNLLPIVTKWGTPELRRKLAKYVPNVSLHRAQEISDTIAACSRRIFEEKKRAMEEGDEAVLQQIGEGKDIMSRLLQANMLASEEDKLPDDELLGQMSTFLFAGMDTTSNALSRIIDLLGQHPDVQDRVRAEILEAKAAVGSDEIPYDKLSELPFMDAVCRETLRLYPPVLFLARTAQKDIVMPLSAPIECIDGTQMHEIPVPRGTSVLIGIMACNRNPAVWGPDAREWKPERWLAPLPEEVQKASIPGVYSHLMTFLGGGRSCIGFKFSQLEMKVLLCVLLSNFKFSHTGYKEIVWNIAGIAYPTVGKGGKPSMPMKVEVLKKA